MTAADPYRGAGPRADGTVTGTDLSRVQALRPPARYTDDRKRQIVRAVRRGVVGLDEALAAHRCSPEEWCAWENMTPRHGIARRYLWRASGLPGSEIKRERPGHGAA